MLNKLKPYWPLLILILLGLLVRFYRFSQVPLGLYWDEVAMLADAKKLSQTGTDLHGHYWLQTLFISYGDFKLPVYIWLTTLTVKLFGVSAFSLRFPSLIAGLLTILLSFDLAYKFCKKIAPQFKTKLALATAAVMALSPWSIMFARTGFEGHLGQMFLSLSVWLLVLAREKKDSTKQHLTLFFLAQLSAALATYTYFSVRFVWPVVFILFVSLFSFKLKWQFLLLKLILPLGLFFLCLVPMTRSPLYQASNRFRLGTTSVLNAKDWALESNILRQEAGNSFITRIFYHRHFLLLQELLKNYADHLSSQFLFLTGDPNLRHGTTQHGLFLLVFLPFLLIGLYLLAIKHLKLFIFLIGWWLISLLPASVPEGTPHALRSLNALMPLSLIIGLGFGWSLVKIELLSDKKLAVLIKASLFGLIMLSFSQFANYYFIVYPQKSAASWQAEFKPLAQKICSYRNQASNIYLISADDRLFLWLLTFCPYPATDYQKFVFKDYQLKKMGKIQTYLNKFEIFQKKKTNKLLVTYLGKDKLPADFDQESFAQFALPNNQTYYFYWNQPQ